jgi:4-hydroxybenzoate polyprenyltransferase
LTIDPGAGPLDIYHLVKRTQTDAPYLVERVVIMASDFRHHLQHPKPPTPVALRRPSRLKYNTCPLGTDVSKAVERCAICQEPFGASSVVKRADGPPVLPHHLEPVRKPGAKIERHGTPGLTNRRTDLGEPICTRCATPAEIAELATLGRRLHDLVAIARPDHWFKNVFVLPGAFVAWTLDPTVGGDHLPPRLLVGLGAICLVASSNYVINEVLDAASDRYHPTKRHRPLAAGRVNLATAYMLWLLLMLIGVGAGFVVVSPEFGATLAALWAMGCIYNIKPLRTKDVVYLDVLSEAINNPIRMLAGWYIVSHALPPASLLLSYWMVGCYFMAIKRFAELRDIVDVRRAASYRRSFASYTPERLLVSILFYASAAMLFFGAFVMRYRFELILSFPFIALVMAIYLRLGFTPNSPAQHPEKLYREPVLMASIIICTLLMIVLLAVDIPSLQALFAPTVPPSPFWRLELGR